MGDLSSLKEAMEIEHFRRETAFKVEEYKHQFALNQINAKGVLDLAQGALRTVTLVNGGAMVALLTFLGNKDLPELASRALGRSLVAFALAMIAGLVASAFAYISQLELTYGISSTEGESRKSYWTRQIAIGVAAVAVGGFAAGVWHARAALM